MGEGRRHTPPPWFWWRPGRQRLPILATPDRGKLIVMDFVRHGLHGAVPRFSDRNGENRGGIMRKATEIDLESHPDARIIQHAAGLADALRDLVADLGALIENSDGVAGLHRNGDLAAWRELTGGGPFGSWLATLDKARDVLAGAGVAL